MIPGVTVKIGGKEYVLPPLNLRLYFDHEKDLDVLMKPAEHSNTEYVKAAMDVIVPSLKRNYPDFSDSEFLEVAYSEVPELVRALFTKAGFENVPLEQRAAAVEKPLTQ